MTTQRILIIGATSAMAEHCARTWADRAAADTLALILVGRDLSRLDRVAADLHVRAPKVRVESIVSDFAKPEAIRATIDAIHAQGRIDVALIAHGLLPDQAQCQQDLTACAEALEVNGLSPVLFAEAIAGHMEKASHGTLAIIGSVAGDRGRKSNYVYGAAKGLVSRYAQGLQHRLASTQVKVVLIKPGPTDTPMTAHLKGAAKLTPVSDVAITIVKAIDAGKATVYAPGKWLIIMHIIRHIPAFIFNKINI
jgi:decaprenylphospho-beta-D-erythro-pentofuranosid-2-ulose 2-reductase